MCVQFNRVLGSVMRAQGNRIFFFFLNNNKRNQRYCVIFRAAKGKQLCAVNTEHL